MSSWIKIIGGVIAKRVDGAHNLPTAEGWREVAYPSSQWKIDALGRVIKKSRANMDADAQPKINAMIEDRQRIAAKIETASSDKMQNLLTALVLRFPDLENEL